jgi:hypothetical protein
VIRDVAAATWFATVTHPAKPKGWDVSWGTKVDPCVVRTPCGLAAQMTRIIALMALTTLGLSGTPGHEPVHAEAPLVR